MTLMEILRPSRVERADDHAEQSSWLPPAVRDVVVGFLTGVISLGVVLVPTVLAWMIDPAPGQSFAGPVGVGASTWLMIHGAHVGAGGATMAFVPLGLGALAVWGAARGCERALDPVEPEGSWAGLLPRSFASVLGLWWLGYAACVALAWALSLGGPIPAQWISVPIAAVVVPVIAMLVAVGRRGEVWGAGRADGALPEVVRRAWRSALSGVGVLVGVGVAVVVLAVVLRWDAVSSLHAGLGAGWLGGALLAVVQVGALPNLGLWAMSALAGPGFSVVDGAHTSLAGSSTGLMPLVPVLGALPPPGDYPLVLRLLVVVPVCVGAWIARRSMHAIARLSSPRTKGAVASAACLIAAALVTLLDVVGGGSLGAYRLSDVGAPALLFGGCLAAEMLVGAWIAVAWDAWRLRR